MWGNSCCKISILWWIELISRFNLLFVLNVVCYYSIDNGFVFVEMIAAKTQIMVSVVACGNLYDTVNSINIDSGNWFLFRGILAKCPICFKSRTRTALCLECLRLW